MSIMLDYSKSPQRSSIAFLFSGSSCKQPFRHAVNKMFVKYLKKTIERVNALV